MTDKELDTLLLDLKKELADVKKRELLNRQTTFKALYLTQH